MNKVHVRIGSAALAFTLLLYVAPSKPRPQRSNATDIVLEIDPAKSKVHWTVDSTLHTVHGTFTVKSGSIRFDPDTGRASGEIVVNAMSGESGNQSRDARLHKEILETPKYPDVVFRPTQLEGKVAVSGPFDSKVRGIFSIHGVDHEIVAPVHAEITRGHWKETSQFEVPYVSWGIKDPSNFFLRVKPTVVVDLELTGEAQSGK